VSAYNSVTFVVLILKIWPLSEISSSAKVNVYTRDSYSKMVKRVERDFESR
jgi:hypothetical protein